MFLVWLYLLNKGNILLLIMLTYKTNSVLTFLIFHQYITFVTGFRGKGKCDRAGREFSLGARETRCAASVPSLTSVGMGARWSARCGQFSCGPVRPRAPRATRASGVRSRTSVRGAGTRPSGKCRVSAPRWATTRWHPPSTPTTAPAVGPPCLTNLPLITSVKATEAFAVDTFTN